MRSASLPPRLVALFQVVLLSVPLAALGHYHAPGHDGGVPHFETDHGGHVVAAPELSERISSSPAGLPPAAASGGQDLLPLPAFVATAGVPGTVRPHPARPPPGSPPARAPPARP